MNYPEIHPYDLYIAIAEDGAVVSSTDIEVTTPIACDDGTSYLITEAVLDVNGVKLLETTRVPFSERARQYFACAI